MEPEKQNFLKFLTVLLTVGIFALVGMMFFFTVPADIKDIFNMMLGSIVTAWLGFMTYWVGSSAGSTKKDETIGAIATSSANDPMKTTP